MFVLVQFSVVLPKSCQFIHIGQHWNRLAKKKAIVQMRMTAIIVHTVGLTKVPLKILEMPVRRYGQANGRDITFYRTAIRTTL